MLRIYYIREFCILPSCNFLHPDPITQYPDSCRASHSDLVQYCSTWRSCIIAQGMATVINTALGQCVTRDQPCQKDRLSSRSVLSRVQIWFVMVFAERKLAYRQGAAASSRLLYYLKVNLTGKDA